MNRATDSQGDGHRDPSSPANAEAAQDSDARVLDDNTVATIASVAVVGIGAAVFEAALIPGIIIGAAAAWLPGQYPKMGETLEPLLRTAAGGAKTLNTAATVFDVASGLGRLGLRGGPTHRAFSVLSWGLRAFSGNPRSRRGGRRRH